MTTSRSFTRLFNIFRVLVTMSMLFSQFGWTVSSASATCLSYVNAGATGSNTGTSWTDAYTDLQSAIGGSCSEIWVADGTYKPTTGTDRSATFQLENGVAIYGGFAGDETAREARDPATNATILSGDIGTASDNSDNSYHVVTGASGATLDGFTITAGNANGENPNEKGGGLYNWSNSPTIRNVTFSGNSAYAGGGMYNFSSSPTLTGITFNGNSATTHGGGMQNENSSSPTLTNVTFSGNTAYDGGGMFNNYLSSPILTNVTITGNSAVTDGGGIYNTGEVDEHTQIRNTIAWGNTGGDQIHNYNAAPDIYNSVIEGGCPASSNTCTNIINSDPMLGTLGDHGGFTWTIPLEAGSSAIDTANDPVCPSTDQRGVSRPQGAHCDIGAYESTDPLPVEFGKSGPADGATNVPSNPTLAWGASSGADFYAYCIDTSDDDICNPGGVPGDWTATGYHRSVDLSGLIPGTTYYWQVRTNASGFTYADGETNWWSFTIAGSPPPVFIVSFRDNWVGGWNWHSGNTMTLTVDNNTDPGDGVCYTDHSQTVAGDGSVWFNVDSNDCDLVTGQWVTMSDGISTKSTQIKDVHFDTIDQSTDTAIGRGPANAGAEVTIRTTGLGESSKHITIGPGGGWTAIFTELHSIQNIQDAHIILYDNDGDGTQSNFDVNFSARLTENQVHGYNWKLGAEVTLTIHDPGDGSGPGYTLVQSSTAVIANWNPDQTWTQFDLALPEGGYFILGPGQTITMTDGHYTKALTVNDLKVTGASAETDIVSGTADPGSYLDVRRLCDSEGCASRRMTADAVTGEWIADFHLPTPGSTNPDELKTFDILPSTTSEVTAPDVDGDSTFVQWGVYNPSITAYPDENIVKGESFQANGAVTLTINDPTNGPGTDVTLFSRVRQTGGRCTGWCVEFQLPQDFDLAGGQIVTLDDGTTNISYTVSNLAITNIDMENDIIIGTADPYSAIDLVVWFRDVNRHVSADEDGNWIADFHVPGSEPDEQNPCDFSLDPLCAGMALQSGTHGQTRIDWHIPDPWFYVFRAAGSTEGDIHGYDFPVGTSVHLTIVRPESSVHEDVDMYLTAGNGLACGNSCVASPNLEFEPGDLITLTYIDRALTHTLTSVQLLQVDPIEDIVNGMADAGSIVSVSINQKNQNFYRSITVPESGAWMVDFSEVGEDGEEIADIQPGDQVHATQSNGAGATDIHYFVPNPNFYDRATPNDEVKAREWPNGVTLTLKFYDSPSMGTLLDTFTQLTGTNPNNPSEIGYAFFNLNGAFDIQPGMYITLTDGTTTQTHTVTDLHFTDIDLAADTVTGRANPNARVDVWACPRGSEDCGNRNLTANGDGDFVANFHVPDGNGNPAFNLDYGTWIDSQEWDSDFINRTMYGQNIPDNRIEASVWTDRVMGYDFLPGRDVTVSIYDPSSPTPGIPVFSQTQGSNGGGYVEFFPSPRITAGHVINMTDGTNSKTLEVSSIQASGVDMGLETVEGISAANTKVDVSLDASLTLSTTSNGNGEWSVDFTGSYDLAPGSTVRIDVRDDDRDMTFLEFPAGSGLPCLPGDMISGHIFALDSSTPVGGATVYFSDYDSDAQLFASITGPDGIYSCGGITPDNYRIWADMGNVDNRTFSRQYYLLGNPGTIYENASQVVVGAGTHLTDVDITYQKPAPIYMHLTFNMSRSIPGDALVRQAIALGTDRQRIIDEVAPGSSILDSFVLPGEWAYATSGLPHYGYNPTLAASTLEGAGWVVPVGSLDGIREKGAVPLKVNIRMRNDPARIQAAEIFKENMAAIGMEVEIIIDPNNRQIIGAHDFDIALFGWMTDENADFEANGNAIWTMFKSNGPNNVGSYSKPAVDGLLSDIASLRTRAAALPKIQDIQIAVMNDLGTLPLYNMEQPPSAYAGEDRFVVDSLTTILDGSGSTDPYNDIALYEWDTDNDGQYDDATGVNPTVTFPGYGTYTVGLKVTDHYNMTSTDTVVITDQPAGTISGTVNDLTSIPITGYAIGVTVTTPDGAINIAQTCTNPLNGQYTVAGVPQNTQVLIYAGDIQCGLHPYATEYWQHSDSRIPPTEITLTGGTPNQAGIDFTLGTYLNTSIEYYFFNFDNPILAETAVRQAIAYGTDRGRLLNEAFLTGGEVGGVIQNSYLPNGHWAAAPNSALTLYPFDPDQARNILATAGWAVGGDGIRAKGGQRLTLTFKTTQNGKRVAAGGIFQQEMKDIGIEIITEFVPAGTFFAPDGTIFSGDFDIAEFTNSYCISVEDETCIPYPMLLSGNHDNFGHYSSLAADTEAHAIETASTHAEKLAHAIQHQAIISQDLALLPLFTRGVNGEQTDTPAGEDISIVPTPGLTILFDHVEQAGVTVAAQMQLNPTDLPGGFELLGTVYEVGTSAQFTTAQVCFHYDDSGLTPLQELLLKLYHQEGLAWVDVTDAGYPDTSANVICGTVSSFSPFAILTPSEYTLTTEVTGSGHIERDKADPYHYGDVVELNAVADTGWSFAGWSGGLGGSTNPDSILIDGDKSVTATFTQNCYTLTLGHTGNGSTPSANPTHSTGCEEGKYVYDQSISLSGAIPGAHWHISGWNGTMDNGSTADTNSVTMPNGAHSASVIYAQDEFTLTVNLAGNGHVDRDNNDPYHYSDVVQLTADADLGWTFSGWSGDLGGSVNPENITIDGNKTVTATFTQNVYTLTVTPVGNGHVERNNAGPYHYGDVVQLTAVADPGWIFSGWSGGLGGSDNPKNITIDGNKSVTATFTKIIYKVYLPLVNK